MENYPLISIIIPTYNRSQLLRRSVKQAFIHDYPNYEVIVSNNASTDKTAEVLTALLRDYPKLKIINHPTLLPLSIHWDTVIRTYSKGTYILVIPDDDIIIDSNYLSKAVDLFNTHQSAGIVFGNYRNIDAEGKELEAINANFETFLKKEYFYENYNKTLFGIKGIGIPHLTAVFSKESYLRVGGFDIKCLCPDTYLWLKIMLFFDLCFVQDCVAEYMIHPNNISKTANLDLFYLDTKIIDAIKPWAKESNIPAKIISKTLKRMELKFLQSYFYSVINNLNIAFFKTILSVNYYTILKFVTHKNSYRCEN